MSLQTIYELLESPQDIFKYIPIYIPKDDNEYFVCYKIWCEYGVNMV